MTPSAIERRTLLWADRPGGVDFFPTKASRAAAHRCLDNGWLENRHEGRAGWTSWHLTEAGRAALARAKPTGQVYARPVA